MEHYPKEQLVSNVEQYFQNYKIMSAIVNKFCTRYGRNADDTCEESNWKIQGTGRPKTICSSDNIEVKHEGVGESPGTSIRRNGQELQILRSSLLILTNELCLHTYKIQFFNKTVGHLTHRKKQLNYCMNSSSCTLLIRWSELAP